MMFGCRVDQSTILRHGVWPEDVDELLAIARAYPNCIVVADEIYDGLDFTGRHVSVASRSSDVPGISLNGVSGHYAPDGVLATWRSRPIESIEPCSRTS